MSAIRLTVETDAAVYFRLYCVINGIRQPAATVANVRPYVPTTIVARIQNRFLRNQISVPAVQIPFSHGLHLDNLIAFIK